MSKHEIWSVVATAAMGLIAAIGAYMSMDAKNILGLAVSVGALGGLVHEIVQTGGKIMFVQKRDDGVYLGSIAGMALGTVAGVLVVRSELPAMTGLVTTDQTMVRLAYEIFLAGLALKGVSEAAGGNTVSSPSPEPQPQAGLQTPQPQLH
jgi:hypothetical protein